MGCGCGARAVAPTPPSPGVFVRDAMQPAPSDCQYTLDMFQVWLTKLICCKNKNLYIGLGINAQTMNKYMGLVMSALNFPSNPCYFQTQLGPVNDFIILITNTGQC